MAVQFQKNNLDTEFLNIALQILRYPVPSMTLYTLNNLIMVSSALYYATCLRLVVAWLSQWNQQMDPIHIGPHTLHQQVGLYTTNMQFRRRKLENVILL